MTIRTDTPPRRVFYVVFNDRLCRPRRWWHLFCRPGFYHCWCYSETSGGVVVLQALERRWNVDWYQASAESFAAQLLADGRTRILVIDRPGDARYNPCRPIYCVQVVKAALGLLSSAWTPFQLYRDLLQMGAVEIGAPDA